MSAKECGKIWQNFCQKVAYFLDLDLATLLRQRETVSEIGNEEAALRSKKVLVLNNPNFPKKSYVFLSEGGY